MEGLAVGVSMIAMFFSIMTMVRMNRYESRPKEQPRKFVVVAPRNAYSEAEWAAMKQAGAAVFPYNPNASNIPNVFAA